MKYPRNNANLSNARTLRKNMTPHERHLWYDFLRYCNPRFRRQELLGDYIADFFCYEAKLVIELDGSQHYDPNELQKDVIRTDYFHSLGIKVLRFSNADITTRFPSVCEAISLAMADCNVLLTYAEKE